MRPDLVPDGRRVQPCRVRRHPEGGQLQPFALSTPNCDLIRPQPLSVRSTERLVLDRRVERRRDSAGKGAAQGSPGAEAWRKLPWRRRRNRRRCRLRSSQRHSSSSSSSSPSPACTPRLGPDPCPSPPPQPPHPTPHRSLASCSLRREWSILKIQTTVREALALARRRVGRGAELGQKLPQVLAGR